MSYNRGEHLRVKNTSNDNRWFFFKKPNGQRGWGPINSVRPATINDFVGKKFPLNSIKLFRNKDIYTFKIEDKRHFKINNLELCKTYEEILEETPEEPVFNMPSFPKELK